MLELIKYPQRKDWKVLLERPAIDLSLLENKVSGILTEVKQSGDEALKRLTLQFDKIELRELKVSEEEMRTAENFVSSEKTISNDFTYCKRKK
jgi:histidinol dehydrogenase